MLSIHVAEFAQSAQKRVPVRSLGLRPDHVGGRLNTEEPDPVDLARRLGAGNAGHHERTEGEAADEEAPVHRSITSSVHSPKPCRRPPAATRWVLRRCGERWL